MGYEENRWNRQHRQHARLRRLGKAADELRKLVLPAGVQLRRLNGDTHWQFYAAGVRVDFWPSSGVLHVDGKERSRIDDGDTTDPLSHPGPLNGRTFTLPEVVTICGRIAGTLKGKPEVRM